MHWWGNTILRWGRWWGGWSRALRILISCCRRRVSRILYYMKNTNKHEHVCGKGLENGGVVYIKVLSINNSARGFLHQERIQESHEDLLENDQNAENEVLFKNCLVFQVCVIWVIGVLAVIMVRFTWREALWSLSLTYQWIKFISIKIYLLFKLSLFLYILPKQEPFVFLTTLLKISNNNIDYSTLFLVTLTKSSSLNSMVFEFINIYCLNLRNSVIQQSQP